MEQCNVQLSCETKPTLFANGAVSLYALPDLTPTHEKIIGAQVSYTQHAQNILIKALNTNVSIHPAYFAHTEITQLLRLGITLNVFTPQCLGAILQRLSEDPDVDTIVSDLKKRYVSQIAPTVIDAVEPCKAALKKFNVTDNDNRIGYLCIDTETGGLHYSLYDCVEFFPFNITRFSEPAKFAIVACLRAFGALANISTLSHETRDWELYYCIDALTEKKRTALGAIEVEDNAKTTLKRIKKIMGKKAYLDFKDTFVDYFGDEDENENFADTIVARIRDLVDEVAFDNLPIFNADYSNECHNFDALPQTIAPLLTQIKNQNERAAILQLVDLAKTVSPFIKHTADDLESASDIALWSQQYLYLEGFYDHICEPRAQEIEDHLMQTGEVAQMIIDPSMPESIEAFTNIQIGYLTTHIARHIVGELA